MRSGHPITLALASAAATIFVACSTVDAPVGEGPPDDSVKSRILFDSNRGGTDEIYVMDPDGSNVQQLTRVAQKGITSTFPDWSPDRKQIVFSSDRPGPPPSWNDLYVMNADGGKVRQLTVTPEVSENNAGWSPDGRHIVYNAAPIAADRTRQAAQIWIIDADGSNARPLTTGSSQNSYPAWSPNGLSIAFISDRDADVASDLMSTEDGAIYLMEADGSNVRRLTEDRRARAPVWSPDGKRIAFDTTRDGNFEIYVINADGSDQRRLTNDSHDDARPTWSPDGREVAFNCLRPEKFEICVIRIDGSGLRTLMENEVFDGHPDWW